MNYIVEIGGRRLEVGIDGDSITIDGERASAHLADIEGTPVRLVTLGSAVHRVTAERGASRGRYTLRMDGWRYEVEALDERTRAIRDLTVASAPSGPAPLKAPMPGLIVRVTVGVGDAVQAGQGLVVMEAMKMENELRAPAAGVVTAVHVAPGAAVDKGALLVELA